MTEPRQSKLPAKTAPVVLAEEPAHPLPGAPDKSVSEPPEPLWGGVAGPVIDRQVHAAIARMTGGLSPASFAAAWGDWAMHLAISPGKQSELVQKGVRKAVRIWLHALDCACGRGDGPCIEPLPQDRRFSDEAWQKWPFAGIYQSFLLNQQWWHNATTDVPGVSPHHEQVLQFASRQLLDTVAPTNFLWTNPVLLAETMRRGGRNLHEGASNFIEDWERAVAGKPPVGAENFRPGQEVAITPGDVVWRNELIELIRYRPTTGKVHPEPVLIVPAWIMKYYILDLSPENSMIRYLVGQGHTVFAISWRNPDERHSNFGLDDYLRFGIFEVLDAIERICPDRKVHATGYCLGGTLLAMAAAAMARDQDDRLASMSLLAAQVDFTEAGELTLFIDESQVRFLEDIMWEQGYLDARQMAGAFQLLRSNDLIWSRLLHEYMMGEREPLTDLMAWNADATRMPFRMHSEYLRGLFLDNDLAQGRFKVDGRLVNLADIRVPIFAVGTEKDHVAPWHSVYKITTHPATDVTFLLTNGGHNAGIVSEPGHKHRHYRMSTKASGDPYVDPDTWAETAEVREGSWWPAWHEWLADRSGRPVAPPRSGKALCAAPGTYVLQR
ncbi:PHA/PHB synthase family protein [Nisaea sediminum]|uniref:PHA/PHB synthase family protein n=1 Tax=Nisaea sediminum TaxID=2775867 RepID=UPI0018665516|nr:alpha/beta fold hydrolase [Nisaea sediminum]